MTRWDWIIEIAKFVLGALMVLDLAACSSSSGWRVSFGVSPVTNVADAQGFDVTKTAKVREARY